MAYSPLCATRCAAVLLACAAGLSLSCGDEDGAARTSNTDGGASGLPDGASGAAGQDVSGGTGGDSGTTGSGGASASGGNGGADGASGAGTTGHGGASDAGDADDAGGAAGHDSGPVPDAGPPDGPAVCGDGWRDPLTEECDDGANSDPAGTCDENCRVCDTLVEPRPPGDGPLRPPSRLIAEGRHPVAAGDSGFAVAFVEREQPNGTIMLKTFGPAGVPGPAAIALNAPAAFTPADADPVITALPGGKYAVAWNDLGGDGDSLGIALAIASPGATPARTFANAGRRLSQHGPDIIATDSEIVVAWEDDDTEVIGSALRLRRFSLSGTPLSATDQTLSAEPSGAVALSRFGSGWAAAWRGRVDTREVIRVKGGTAQWSADVASPAPAGERPALVELDATRLLVVFSETTFPDGGGSTTRVRLAVADVAAPGALTSLPLEPLVAPYSTDPTLGQSQAAVVRAGGSVYLAWRAERVLGDAFSEELWLKRIGVTLSSTEVTLDWSEAEIRLPRSEEQRRGDQRFAALAASSSALFAAWDDYGRTFGLAQGGPDVVVSLIPTPILRLEPLELGR